MITLNGHLVTPTIFPDGTSQVWKVEGILEHMPNVIDWTFQNEAELFHVFQLADLVNTTTNEFYGLTLRLSYLPYARQDKEITNQSTFALKSFINLLENHSGIDQIQVIDAHNPKALPAMFKNILPNVRINDVINECAPTLICFPDAGASARGYLTPGLASFNLDKKRNQTTGEIEGLECKLPLELKDKHILIIDDLIDGGRTFIEAAKLLYNMGAASVYLYGTHGIFSKGVQVLKDAGIKRIFTYNGEV